MTKKTSKSDAAKIMRRDNSMLFRQRQYADSLYHFLKDFWHTVESAEFRDNWHIKVICDHLQAVVDGKVKRLIVNIPPRHSKSLIISVFFPIWCWIRNPSLQIFTGSHSKDLAIRDTTKSRYLLQSEKFKDLFGDVFSLVKDQNQKSNYLNDKHGSRKAFSVMGALIGSGGDIIVVDDPIDADNAYSDVIRGGCNRWFAESLTTRLNNPETGAIIVIMQRVHMLDLAGCLIEEGGWEHLCLPFEFDPDRRCSTFMFTDPRTESGELLHNYWSKETIARKKKEMGSYAWGAQMQQLPILLEGGLVKMAWWKYFDARIKKFKNPIISLDTAFKEGRNNDYTVCTVWGQERIDNDNHYYLLDMLRQRLAFPELKRLLSAIINKYQPSIILIEDAASGQSLIQEFRQLTKCVIIPVKVDKGKATRVHMTSALIEAGQVHLDEKASYLVDIIKEFTDFPMGEHDDIVDSMTQALIYMREQNTRAPKVYYL